MKRFSSFLDLLAEIEDPRRAEGKLYRLPHVVLFTILAAVAGANSYCDARAFINPHLPRLRKLFGLKWRKAPAYAAIRRILQQLDAAAVERIFRAHAMALINGQDIEALRRRQIAIDGKALRHSVDCLHDRKAPHILSAFATDHAPMFNHIDLRREIL